MSWAIETKGLTKYYPGTRGWSGLLSKKGEATLALDHIDLTIKRGELFGLVGPNGAGKTTLIKTLCTLILPTKGSASVNGYDLSQETAIKSFIGLVTSDERSFYWRLSGRQNLEFFSRLQSIAPGDVNARVGEVLETVDLQKVADNRFLTYSTGMRQRLSIARALLNRPTILFLDEPTRGLDPHGIQALHSLIREDLTDRQGITIFLTSHWLQEVEQLCDRIAIMNHGRLLACGSMAELRRSIGVEDRFCLRISGYQQELGRQIQAYVSEFTVKSDDKGDAVVEFELKEEMGQLGTVLDMVRSSSGQILNLSTEPVSLETIFSRMTDDTNAGHIRQITTGESNAILPEKYRLTSSREVEAVSASSRTSFLGRLINQIRIGWAFLRRDAREEASYRLSFLLQFLNIFFSVGLFYFIARLLGGAAAPLLEPYGGDYFSFVLIGIAFAGYFGVGLSSFSSSLRQAQTTGTLEAMLTTPASLPTIIISSSLWNYLLTTIRVIVYLLVGVIFLGVNLEKTNYPGALAILILTVITFSSLGILAASFIMVLKRGDPITWLFSATSNFLGGVYYPITILPGWMQFFAYLLPVTYALRAIRLALLQGASTEQLKADILILLLFSAVLLPTSLLAFGYAVRKARVDGSLSHF